jgi:hypothetical protein
MIFLHSNVKDTKNTKNTKNTKKIISKNLQKK